MKRSKLFALGLIAFASVFTACNDDDDDDNNTPATGNRVISQNITGNTTWSNGRVIELDGRIYVEDGATLTIEPGTIIKAQAGKEAQSSALIVSRGGTLIANGTETEPIIFTSVLDEIQPGEIVSPNLDASFAGLWGGLIMLGNANISADAAEVQVEGIPTTEDALYGGTDDSDNSGSVSYVSIRHGGTLLGDGNEINGFTLGGVGNGTTIDRVEVVANLDDGIEWFGGSVNMTNALVWYQGDDAYDVDQSFSGTVDNFVYKGGPDSDHGLEIDGPEGSYLAGCTFTNGTLIGYNEGYDPEDGWGGNFGEYADFRDGARGNFNNLNFSNHSENSDFELDDDATSTNFTNGDLVFSNIEFNVNHLEAGNLLIDDIVADKSDIGTAFDGGINFATVNNGAATVGADLAPFAGWSLGSATGEL